MPTPIESMLGRAGDPPMCRVFTSGVSVHWWAPGSSGACLCGETPARSLPDDEDAPRSTAVHDVALISALSMPDGEMLTPAEWCQRLNVKVVDPDGWRDGARLGWKPWSEPITEGEFKTRLVECTIDSRGNAPDALFDRALEAMHRTDVTITVAHRFPIGSEVVDVAGGHWRIAELVWRSRAMYRLTPLDDMARASVLGGLPHPTQDRLENVPTIDRHFNPA